MAQRPPNDPAKPAAQPPATPPAPLPAPPDFVAAARDLGVEFEPGELESLGRYLALLLEANEQVNLTAITEPAKAWHRHILDALALMPLLVAIDPDGAEQPAAVRKVVDVGTGGGVPGIPLAIVMPQWQFALLEPTGRKAEFLHRAVAALGLKNVQVVNARAERIGHEPAHREAYDAAVVRGVGPLNIIVEFCLPLVRPGGLVLAVKGEKAPAELEESREAIATLGGVVEQIVPTPTGQIVVLSKGMRTPKIYPRADGEPKRKPLGAAPASAPAEPKATKSTWRVPSAGPSGPRSDQGPARHHKRPPVPPPRPGGPRRRP